MENIKYSLYKNNVLVYQEDTRLVSVCAQEKISQIRLIASSLIGKTGVDWMASRELSGGKPIPQLIKDQCAEYRKKSNDLEAMVITFRENAINDEDKDVCDSIENIVW